jgi:uncharacterized protein
MNMMGEIALSASPEEVWAKLNDPTVLANCIPGCQSIERVGENGFAAVTKLKIGPVSATFRGKVDLTDIVPAESCRIVGSGDGGLAGFARGGATATLAAVSEGCLLKYQVEANVGGKLAQLGARFIDGVAKKLADQFFQKFAEAVSESKQMGD